MKLIYNCKMGIKCGWLIILILIVAAAEGQPLVQKTGQRPIDLVKKIGDKLVRETPFAYRLRLSQPDPVFDGIHFIDFGRNYQLGKPAVAYAFTQMSVQKDTLLTVEIAHSDACKIWCNGNLVYERRGTRPLDIERDERSMFMSDSFTLHLQKGANRLLVKSETAGKQWCVFLQPPSDKDAVKPVSNTYPEIGLTGVKNVDTKISDLTDWLLIGPFSPGLDQIHAPEKELYFGRMYPGLSKPVTWEIPKLEILGDLINPKSWGTADQWNYHNGGLAWAMQQLSEYTGVPEYDKWAADYCDFQIESIPFIDYQVHELHAYNSVNAMLIGSKLLDFTLAPTLPFIYRLRKSGHFKNDSLYSHFVHLMIQYAKDGQIRSPGYRNYTRTSPEKYTVWVDDMFMGIPFLIQAGLYVHSATQQKYFFDDAAAQLIDFDKHVWDKDARLYMHASYSTRPGVKLPHWARANGWAIWAMTEVLMALPENHPRYQEILAKYRDFSRSLIRFQDKAGFWPNVIDRADSPEEVSGTAIFAMALARGIRLGWLNAKQYLPVVQAAWKAVASQIEADGTVHKICIGTMCSEDTNYYLTRPLVDNDTHGSFAVIFAGIEVQKMLDSLKMK